MNDYLDFNSKAAARIPVPAVIQSVCRHPRSDNYGEILVITTDKALILLELYSGCCSHSFFESESVKEAKGLVGQTLISLKEVGSGQGESDNSETKYHALEIRTGDGVVTVDWRNESNGYYDGEIMIFVHPAKPCWHASHLPLPLPISTPTPTPKTPELKTKDFAPDFFLDTEDLKGHDVEVEKEKT